MWTVIAVITVVALVLVLGGGYAVAGFASASGRLTTANHAISNAVAHREAFDGAPSAFEVQAGDAKTLKSDADKFVKAWQDQSATIAHDATDLSTADSGLHQQQWLTVVRRGNLDSASARISHARKALSAAMTIAAEHVKEGQVLQALANVFIDEETTAADAQSADLRGAATAAAQMVTDANRVAGMLGNDPQFPPELAQFVAAVKTLAQDFVDYLNAVATGDKPAITSLTAKANADIDAVGAIDLSQVGTKIDEYYQPYLDTYHSELSRAEKA